MGSIEKEPFADSEEPVVRFTRRDQETAEIEGQRTVEVEPFIEDHKGPVDKKQIVYLIILLHGIGTLMPWNMFITIAPRVSFA